VSGNSESPFDDRGISVWGISDDVCALSAAEVFQSIYEGDVRVFAINFGISSYSRQYPGVPWEERVLEIPEDLKLPRIDFSHLYKDCVPRRIKIKNYSNVRADLSTPLPTVRFELTSTSRLDQSSTYLIWIESRSEWVAVRHIAWEESGFSTDELERGPYALDRHCKAQLARAYYLHKHNMPKTIETTGPKDLDIMWSNFDTAKVN
jgi:hypothetical protein